MNRTVYLAGPIKGLNYADATDWRLTVAAALYGRAGIVSFDPMRGKGYLVGEDSIGDSYQGTFLSNDKAITIRDRYDVMRCGLVLANLRGANVASIGTAIEFGWADAFRIPVVAVMTEEDIMWHGMIRQLSLAVVPNLEIAIDVIIHILGEE
jgi:nucleoside 2-deoxyribosyltransferase